MLPNIRQQYLETSSRTELDLVNGENFLTWNLLNKE